MQFWYAVYITNVASKLRGRTHDKKTPRSRIQLPRSDY